MNVYKLQFMNHKILKYNNNITINKPCYKCNEVTRYFMFEIFTNFFLSGQKK